MSFNPSVPNGQNASASSAISRDGRPTYQQKYTIAPRTGRAVHLIKGDVLTLINPSGHQVCDFWAFRFPNLNEYMSMAHCHTI